MGSHGFNDLATATAHADDQVPELQSRFGATTVKIVDARGMPHYLKSISRTLTSHAPRLIRLTPFGAWSPRPPSISPCRISLQLPD